jgi:hypothetical protein
MRLDVDEARRHHLPGRVNAALRLCGSKGPARSHCRDAIAA